MGVGRDRRAHEGLQRDRVDGVATPGVTQRKPDNGLNACHMPYEWRLVTADAALSRKPDAALGRRG